MTMQALLASVAVAAMTSAPDLRAEEPQNLDVGTRIRVVVAGADKAGFKGKLVARDSEQLVLEPKPGRDPVTIPYGQVVSLHVSEGRARGKAAAIGALVGIAAAGALFLTHPPECSGAGCVEFFALIAAPTAATGALIGALGAPERWRDVPARGRAPASVRVSERIRVGIGPVQGGGVRFAASCLF
jgi:hypothetical protein